MNASHPLSARGTRVSYLALLLFVAGLALVYWVRNQDHLGGAYRLAASLVPAAGWLWGYWASEREMAKSHDERMRKIRTEGHAIAYPLALGIILLLGTLDSVGLGLFPPEVYWAIGGLAYFVGHEIAQRRYS